MNFYLVDYENVKTHGLDGVNKLTSEDAVYIFYSEKADSLTFGLHRRLNESKATIQFQKVEVGTKNALDFQLSSFLGYLICQNQGQENCNFYIVTKDNGFASLITYWARKKINISIVADVSKQFTNNNTTEESDEITTEVAKLINDQEIVTTVVTYIRQYKTKQGINNALMKKYPSKDHKKASEIYNLIKPLIADKKGK